MLGLHPAWDQVANKHAVVIQVSAHDLDESIGLWRDSDSSTETAAFKMLARAREVHALLLGPTPDLNHLVVYCRLRLRAGDIQRREPSDRALLSEHAIWIHHCLDPT